MNIKIPLGYIRDLENLANNHVLIGLRNKHHLPTVDLIKPLKPITIDNPIKGKELNKTLEPNKPTTSIRECNNRGCIKDHQTDTPCEYDAQPIEDEYKHCEQIGCNNYVPWHSTYHKCVVHRQ